MNAQQLSVALVPYLLRDLVLLLFALIAWWLMRRYVVSRLDPRPATHARPLWQQFGYGLAAGVAAAALIVLLAWAGGGFRPGADWTPYAHRLGADAASGVLLWGFFALQSLCEELLFRAIGVSVLATIIFWAVSLALAPLPNGGTQRLLGWLWLISGALASAVVAVAFAFAHRSNPDASPLALTNIALAGMVLGQLLWMQGTCLGAWGWHWIWNSGLASLGLPVSGVHLTPMLLGFGFSGARAGIISGGPFGPEGSVACTLVLTGLWLWLCWQAARGILPGQSRQSAEASAPVAGEAQSPPL